MKNVAVVIALALAAYAVLPLKAGLGFTILIATLVALWLVVGRTARWRPEAAVPMAAVLIAAAIPAALLQVNLSEASSDDRFGDFRIAVEGLSFDLKTFAGPVRVGGDAGKDHLIVDRLPPGMLRFEAKGTDVEIRRGPLSGNGHAGLIEFGQHGNFVGVHKLEAQSEFCVNDCNNSDNWLKVDPASRMVTKAQGPAVPALRTIPLRTMHGVVPVARQRSPAQEIFPLRLYSPPVVDGTTASFLYFRDALHPLTSAAGWLSEELNVALVDAGAGIRVNGNPLPPADDLIARLSDSGVAGTTKSIRLALHRINISSLAGGQSLDHDNPLGRLSERRSFTANIENNRLNLVFDTPHVITVKRQALLSRFQLDKDRRVEMGQPAPEPNLAEAEFVLRRAIQGAGNGGQTYLPLPFLGESLTNQLFGRVAFAADSEKFKLITESGRWQHAFGDGVFIGNRGGVLLRITKLEPPEALWWLVGAITAFATLCTWRQRKGYLAWVLFSAAEILLAVRLLVAIEAGYVDPASEAALRLSLLGFVVVPFLLSLVPLPPRKDWGWIALHGFGATVIVAVLVAKGFSLGTGTASPLLSSGLNAVKMVFIGGTALAALVLAACAVVIAEGVLRGKRSLPDAIADTPQRFAAWKALAVARVGQTIGRIRWDSPWTLFAITFLVMMTRAGLGFFGAKEAISFGPRIALSIFYVPLTLLLFSFLFWRARTQWTDSWRGWLLYILMGGMLFGPLILVSDNGAAIYALPIILFAALLHLHTEAKTEAERKQWARETVVTLGVLYAILWTTSYLLVERISGTGVASGTLVIAISAVVLVLMLVWLGCRAGLIRTSPWLWPAATIVGAILFLHAVPHLEVGSHVSMVEARQDETRALALIEHYVKRSQNELRLWNHLWPKRLNEAGTLNADEFRLAMANLKAYTSSGQAFGRGFLNLEPPPTQFRATHVNDNVSAVHILSPFGHMGGATFVAMLAALAWIAYAGMRPPSEWKAPCEPMGVMVVWTIFAVGSFMFLANLQFLPFTGKNVYFLAAASLGDLIEGTLLLMLAKHCLARKEGGNGEQAKA